MWKCMKCNEVFSGDSRICRKCGSILEEVVEETETPPAVEFPEVEPSPAVTEAPEISTEMTGTANSSSMDFLRSLAEAEEASQRPQASGEWRCPRCSETVQANFNVCWNCGTARDGTEDPDFVRADATDAVDRVARRCLAPTLVSGEHAVTAADDATAAHIEVPQHKRRG